MLYLSHLYTRQSKKAVSEITCAVFGDDWYRETMTKEAQAYELLLDLYEESDIYEGMSVKELDKLLEDKYKNRYLELSLFSYFGEITTNKDRFKKEEVIIRNFKMLPRCALRFVIRNYKITSIQKIEDSGRNYLWGGL